MVKKTYYRDLVLDPKLPYLHQLLILMVLESLILLPQHFLGHSGVPELYLKFLRPILMILFSSWLMVQKQLIESEIH